LDQKIDPETGIIYTKDVYDPEKPKPKTKEVWDTYFDTVVVMVGIWFDHFDQLDVMLRGYGLI